MKLVEYLMCVATRHELAKDEHLEELKELRLRRKNSGLEGLTLAYEDDAALLKGAIGSVCGKPSCLNKVSLAAIGALAHLLKAKMANDPFIQGHEIITKLVCDPEKTVLYLESFAELKEQGWNRLIETPGSSFLDDPPFCWLQSHIELTGGEIRLVVERAVRLQAYRGITALDRTTLMKIAREELAGRMTRDGNTTKIGFATRPADHKGGQS